MNPAILFLCALALLLSFWLGYWFQYSVDRQLDNKIGIIIGLFFMTGCIVTFIAAITRMTTLILP